MGDEDADFWVVRRGSHDKVGMPTREYNPEHYGIKVKSDALLPSYLYYAMQHIHNAGYYKDKATGTTNLKNIRKNDIEDIPIR